METQLPEPSGIKLIFSEFYTPLTVQLLDAARAIRRDRNKDSRKSGVIMPIARAIINENEIEDHRCACDWH